MKIKKIYTYGPIKDIENDWIEVRILTEPEPGDKFPREYAISVTTIKYIQDFMAHKKWYHYSYVASPTHVLPKLDMDTIMRAIEDMLPELHRYAYRIE